MSTLECIGCSRELPIARFSKTQRRELEPECLACTEWRLINPGDAIPTAPPGGNHALRDFEKHGSVARLVTSQATQPDHTEDDFDVLSTLPGPPSLSHRSTASHGVSSSRFSSNLPALGVRANQGAGNSRAPSTWSGSSASSTSGSSSTPTFDKNAYSSASSASGNSSAASKNNDRKWPKGDNRKRFNVLPKWQ